MSTQSVVMLLSLVVFSPWAAAASSNCGGLAEEKDKGGAHFKQPLPFDQDVFSFCAMGYPPHCWVGVSPATGTWKIVSQYCFNAEWTSAYEEICPKGVGNGKPPGTWKNAGKPPLMHKGSPDTDDGLESCAHMR